MGETKTPEENNAPFAEERGVSGGPAKARASASTRGVSSMVTERPLRSVSGGASGTPTPNPTPTPRAPKID